MTMPGPSDYRAPTRRYGESEYRGGQDNLSATMQDLRERAADVADEVATSVRERPYTTMAIAGGLAFAVGALWMLRRRQPRSRLDALLAQLPEAPSREALVARGTGAWKSLSRSLNRLT
jgi:hypothetical protein